MLDLISAALLLGVDSAVVSFALGTCRVPRPRQVRLAAAFGLCDGAASLVGLGLGVSLVGRLEPLGHWGGPALVGLYALLTLWVARFAAPRHRTWLPYALPIVMSLDNLAASFPLAHAAPPLACAAVFGVASGLLSIVGFRAGEFASAALGRPRGPLGIRAESPYLGAAALVSAAVVLAAL